MNYFSLITGILIALLVIFDFAYTSLSANGAGILTGRISRGIWQVFLRICKHGSHPLFKHAGMVTILFNLFTWIILLWVANSFIFTSDPNSIVDVNTGKPANVVEKIYYTGYTLSTLGNGDFKPLGTIWQLFSVIVSFSGLITLTIAITYLLQVFSAEIHKRQLSLYIATLGGTPQSILVNSWNGKDFKKLESDFTGIATLILAHSQNHLAYPILHHFHSIEIKESSAINLTAFDEALTIPILCIPQEAITNLEIKPLRKAITTYLITLESDFIRPTEDSLPIPDLQPLKDAGIPVLEDENKIHEGFQKLLPRRRLLKALLANDGWHWDDLNQPKFQSELDI